MATNPFKVVQELECAVAQYTGAPHCIAVNSCTNALGIVFEWLALSNKSGEAWTVTLPKYTYIGVAMQAKRAGFKIKFEDINWVGEYKISPYDFWDSARRFRKNMFNQPDKPTDCRYKCISFHATKILGHTQGGAILTNDYELKHYAREMRFDGRRFADTPDLPPRYLGRHDYMWPDTAAALLYKLSQLPDNNFDLQRSFYPDLSEMEIFK